MAASERLICAASALVEAGPGVRFEVQYGGEAAPAFAIRWQGEPRAYLNRCAHVPVELDWKPGEFFDDSKLYLICAVHAALYDPADGRCLGGRCERRGLVALDIVQRDDQIFIRE